MSATVSPTVQKIIIDENDKINVILKYLLLSIPGGIIFPSLLGLMAWRMLERLFS